MTVLDTFYILFKSNSDEVSKSLGQVEKDTVEAEKKFKQLTEQTDNLGKSFTRMIEVGAGLAAGYLGLDAVKNGIMDVAKFNAGLGYTASLSGQVAQSFKQIGQAAAQQGGDMNGAIKNIQAVQNNFAAAGLPIPTPEDLMQGWRDTLAGKDKKTQMAMFDKMNIQDTGLRTIATMTPEDFAENQRKAALNTTTTDQDTKAAQDFLRSESELSAAFDKLEQNIGTPLLTALKNFLDSINTIVSLLNTKEQIAHIPQDAANITKGLTTETKNIMYKGVNKVTEHLFNKSFLKVTEPAKLSAADDAELEKYRKKPASAALSTAYNPDATPSKVPMPLATPSGQKGLDPVAEWQNAVTNPDYIKRVQATGQNDIYATEASKAFHSQTNNMGATSNVSVGNVTINTQATDGAGTADAFKDMLHNLAGNASDGVSK